MNPTVHKSFRKTLHYVKKELVTIVIPIHKTEPSDLEKISLGQTLKVLNKYPITFQATEGLDVSWYENFCAGKATIRFERFEWNGFKEYTDLMLNPEFYWRFTNYRFILICHLDVFVFRNELEKWCNAGYDYVGSVIYNTAWAKLPTRLGKLLMLRKPDYVANGGFGLRNVDAFISLTSSLLVRAKLNIWKRRYKFYQDDIFLSQLFPTIKHRFKIPPKEIAQQFGAAFEHWDEKKIPFTPDNEASLPFGVHGWFAYNFDYWKPSIRAHGHVV